MGDLANAFRERLAEIDAYLDLLDAVQKQIATGTSTGLAVTEQQQRILHSSVYLQLYNLVEATITRCIDAVSEAAAGGGQWLPHDLSDQIRRQWVRSMIRDDDDLNPPNRLDGAVHLADTLIAAQPVAKFTIKKGKGGNWDDTVIEDFTKRLGLVLTIKPGLKTEVKRRRRDDKGALELIRKMRNDLAHGGLSFEQCGASDVVSDLRTLKRWTAEYLAVVVDQFEAFIAGYEFLAPEKRPAGAAA
jgi:hypothetical protein